MEGCDAAQEHSLGEGAGVIEPGAGGRLAEDGIDELVAMISRGGFLEGEVLELVGWDDERHPDMGLDDGPVGADENGPLVRQFFVAEERDHVLRGALIAIIPSDFDGLVGGVLRSGEHVFDLRIDGPAPLVRGGTDAFDREGRGEFEGVENWVVDVASHVPEGPSAEVQALAPVAGVVCAVDVRAFCGDSEPEVPRETVGNGVRVGGFWCAVAPFFAAPRVHLLDLPDDTRAHDNGAGTVGGIGVHLDSHLRDQFPFAGILCEFPDLVDVLCQRLLEVAMETELHGGHRLRTVHVVGGADAHGIEVFGLLLEHLAPVLVKACVGAVGAFPEALGSACVHVSCCDEVYGGVRDDGGDVGSSHSSCTEACVANTTTGGGGNQVPDERGSNDSCCTEGCEERTSGGMDQRHAAV